MSENSQVLRAAVVSRSRLTGTLLGLALAHSYASPAAAEPGVRGRPSASAREAPYRQAPNDIEPVPAPERVEYGALLGATYALAPLLAIGAGAGVFELTRDDTLPVIVACSMAVLPATVHAAYGQPGHGALSFLALVGVTGASLVIGGVIGGSITASTCEDKSSDSCDFAALPGIIGGGLIGGVAGYASYAIYDSLANASVVVPRESPERATLGVWVRPLPVLRHPNAEGSTVWSGALLGATLQM